MAGMLAVAKRLFTTAAGRATSAASSCQKESRGKNETETATAADDSEEEEVHFVIEKHDAQTPHVPLKAETRSKLASLHHVIGRTPLLKVEGLFGSDDGKKQPFTIWAKYEASNFTGSIKDRMALHILAEGYRRGTIKEGDTIAEATSGNTGIAFAAIGRALGHQVHIFMPDWMSSERKLLLQSYGAHLHLISREQGGFVGSIRAADRFAAESVPGSVFLPHQFANEDNSEAHYRTTAPELLAQLAEQGLEPSHLVAGVGTGGTVSGMGRLLRQRVPRVAIHPLEPANSPTLRTGKRHGHHRIQGISDEFIPPILDLAHLEPVVDVWDGDAILMAKKLSCQLGLGVGISSGANFLGALKLALECGPSAVVTTIFCDDNKKYLSTDLTHDEPVLPSYLSPHVQLLHFHATPARF